MPAPEKLTTTVSTKGQIILPKAIRQALSWKAGKKLIVEHASEGVLLKPLPVFARTRNKDVFGCLAFRGAPKTVAEMKTGVLAEAKRRHARS